MIRESEEATGGRVREGIGQNTRPCRNPKSRRLGGHALPERGGDVERCVTSAREAIERAGLAGEVVVADNGSTDGSQELAARAGARVVSVAEKGYGAALLGGIAAARGKYVVMGDADDSYDFGTVPLFVAELAKGHDLVMGSRMRGRIEKGAMPFLHRWLGNPILTGLDGFSSAYRSPISTAGSAASVATSPSASGSGRRGWSSPRKWWSRRVSSARRSRRSP